MYPATLAWISPYINDYCGHERRWRNCLRISVYNWFHSWDTDQLGHFLVVIYGVRLNSTISSKFVGFLVPRPVMWLYLKHHHFESDNKIVKIPQLEFRFDYCLFGFSLIFKLSLRFELFPFKVKNAK